MRRIHSTLERLVLADLAVTGFANRVNNKAFLSPFFGAISRLGDGVFWYALMTSILLVNGSSAIPQVAHMMVVGILATAIYKVIKSTLSRPRPFVRAPNLYLSIAPLDQFSFPSGHTMHAVSFTWIAVHYYPQAGIFLWPFAGLVALSRLVLGLHYISDVIAGALLGGGLAYASIALMH